METAPTALNRIYDASAAESNLVTAGTLSTYATGQNYKLQYSLRANEGFSDVIPKGKEKDTYTVYYRVVDSSGNVVYAPSEPVTVTISDTPVVIMSNYTYGTTPPTPGVTGGPYSNVTYYYSTNSNKTGAEQWLGTTALNVGTYYMYASISQEGTGDIETEPVEFTVRKATPVITTAPSIGKTTVYANDGLKDGDLTGGEAKHNGNTVAGTFTITGAKTWATDGQQTTTVKFVPKDTANYNESKPVSITVTVSLREAAAPTLEAKTETYTGEPIAYELSHLPAGVQSAAYYYWKAGDTAYVSTAPTDVGSYTVAVVYTMQVGYAKLTSQTTTLTIEAKDVTPTLEIADGTYTYNGAAQTPTITLKDGDMTIPASEYTVTYSNNVNAGTATVTVTDKAGGNCNFESVKGSNTFEIQKRPVTFVSADAEKEYDGTALKAETVTAIGMLAGEKFTYSFTGSQTDIGTSKNWFTAVDNGRAKADNYSITYAYGTLRVTVPAGIGEGTDDMTEDNVTSDDRETIKSTLDKVNDYLRMDGTNEEKKSLQDLKRKLKGLLERLDEVQDAIEDRTITKTDDITKDNAKPSDKKKLENAKDAIEEILADYGANLTDAEKQELNDKLDRINAALDAIAAEEAASAAKAEAEAAAKSAPESAAENRAVKTGDEAMPLLWLALSLSAALALGYTARKKKN